MKNKSSLHCIICNESVDYDSKLFFYGFCSKCEKQTNHQSLNHQALAGLNLTSKNNLMESQSNANELQQKIYEDLDSIFFNVELTQKLKEKFLINFPCGMQVIKNPRKMDDMLDDSFWQGDYNYDAIWNKWVEPKINDVEIIQSQEFSNAINIFTNFWAKNNDDKFHNWVYNKSSQVLTKNMTQAKVWIKILQSFLTASKTIHQMDKAFNLLMLAKDTPLRSHVMNSLAQRSDYCSEIIKLLFYTFEEEFFNSTICQILTNPATPSEILINCIEKFKSKNYSDSYFAYILSNPNISEEMLLDLSNNSNTYKLPNFLNYLVSNPSIEYKTLIPFIVKCNNLQKDNLRVYPISILTKKMEDSFSPIEIFSIIKHLPQLEKLYYQNNKISHISISIDLLQDEKQENCLTTKNL